MSGILSTAYIPKPAKIFLCWPLGGRLEGILCNEGRDLIDDLTAHISKPEYTYIHKWQPGDVVFWDNRCTQHCAIPYDNRKEDLSMLRTTLEGDTPFHLADDGRRIESFLVSPLEL